jgi:hypothetical protein
MEMVYLPNMLTQPGRKNSSRAPFPPRIEWRAIGNREPLANAIPFFPDQFWIEWGVCGAEEKALDGYEMEMLGATWTTATQPKTSHRRRFHLE